MIRKNYGFRWNSFYRADHGDAETIELMARAGCEGVFLGIESGSDRVLKNMNKTARTHEYSAAIHQLRAAGISTYASLIVGFPGETAETVRETIDFIEAHQPDFFRAQLWYCDPITPIWEKKDQWGIEGSAFAWSHKTMTAVEACAWIDHMFLGVRNSIWLPQFGFEQWSTFYLQRQGMNSDHIKEFLRAFNAAVKERLLFGDLQEPSPAVLAALRSSARFDRPEPALKDGIEAVAAESYVRADHHFLAQWEGRGKGELPARAVGPSEGKWEVVTASPFEGAASSMDRGLLTLVAYGALLAEIAADECPMLFWDDTLPGPVPVVLALASAPTARQLSRAAEAQIADSGAHARFAAFLWQNQRERSSTGLDRRAPVRAGFVRGSASKSARRSPEGPIWSNPDIVLVADVAGSEPGSPIRLWHRLPAVQREQAATWVRRFEALTRQLASGPDSPIETQCLHEVSPPLGAAAKVESFAF
jgi:hypothetical protein